MTTDLREQIQSSLGSAYRIERELGGGGMSRVFAAVDVALERRVVVKVLSPELAAGVNNDRFRREILLAAQLQHPHIVPVLTTGETGALPYFTMPYIEGQSLRTRLDGEHGIAVVEAVGILRDVARALAYAHEHRVVHRDIKPDNVLLSGGSATVTDFGIAKAISTARSAGDGTTLTMVGTSLGTPTYMAPEQIAADPAADHRADIYAFGVMAYEVLSGKPPFHGRSPQVLLTAHLTETPASLRVHAPDVPPSLDALVMRCLAKSPADRPQSAAELLQVLDRLDISGDWRVPGGAPATARASRRPGRRAMTIGAAAVIALVVGGALVVRRFAGAERAVADDVVAVVPFRVASADPALHYLREGMLDLLAAKLTGEGSLRAMEPRSTLAAWHGAGGSAERDLAEADALRMARSLGAGRMLMGEVVGTPIRIVLSATLLRVPDGQRLTRVSVEGAPDSLAWLVDRMAVRLLTDVSGEGEQRLTGLTGISLPALRAYLDGQSKLRRGDVYNAAREFERALAEDSTFALAAVGLHQSLSWIGDGADRQRPLELAWRGRAKLGPRDQAMLAAIAGPRYPASSSTLEVLQARERYAGIAGDRADAWYLLGDHFFHYGPASGVTSYQERALEAFKRASAIDSSYVVPYIHGLQVAVMLGDTATAGRFERLRRAADTSSRWLLIHRWYAARQQGDTAAAPAIIDSLRAGPIGYQFAMLQHAAYDGTGARDAWSAAEQLIANPPTEEARRGWQRQAHDVALAMGKPDAARRLLLASLDTQPDLNALVLDVRDGLVGEGDSAAAEEAARVLARLQATMQVPDSLRDVYRRSIARVMEPWRLSRGDTSQTRRSLEELRAIARTDTTGGLDAQVEIAVIEAMYADAARPAARRSAAERLDSLMRALDYATAHAGRTQLASLVLARLFEHLGDTRRALTAVRRRTDAWVNASPYLAAQLREEGRLAALAGEREQAVRAYRHYLGLRPDPEPSVRAEVDAVRRELAALERESVGK